MNCLYYDVSKMQPALCIILLVLIKAFYENGQHKQCLFVTVSFVYAVLGLKIKITVSKSAL